MTTRSPPVTRKKAATLRVYEDYPASPSELTVPPTETATEPTRLESAPQTEPATTSGTDRRTVRAPSICSRRSTASAAARIKQAELEAEEQLMELRRQELRMQADFIRKKLALDVATIREDTDQESVHNEAESQQRVQNWLRHSHTRGERSEQDMELRTNEPPTRPRERSEERSQMNKVSFDQTPNKQKDGKIERLTDAFEKMVRYRIPSRQTQELPIFSGDPREWLAFKAAMRDSTNLLNLSPAENLARLRACLRGEARQAVSALLYASSTPYAIMQTLEQCYGRPEMIIDQALEEIRKLPRIGTTASELNAFAIKLQNAVTVITCVDDRGYLMNPLLVRSVTEKLSPHIKARWCDYAEEYGHRREAEIITLSKFLMREADRAMRHAFTNLPTARTVPSTTQSRPNEARTNRKPVYATTEDKENEHVKNEQRCLCCGTSHKTTDCGKLKEMTVPKRWEWAKETRTCFRCLNSKHHRKYCKSKRCGINECRHPHHALLHSERNDAVTEQEANIESVTTASAHTNEDQMQVLLKVCPITIQGNNGKELQTYALLDEGSTITLIDEDIATEIGTQGPTRTLNIVGATTSQQEPNSRIVRIKIRGQNKQSHSIMARTVKNLTLGKQSVNADLKQYPHLRELRSDVVCYANAKPRLLIGADNWHLIVTRKLLSGKKRQPAASLTQLGWILHGSMPRSVIYNEETVLHVRTQQTIEPKHDTHDELSELVKAHFDIDALGVSLKKKKNPKEERAIEIFNRTAKRTNGRFEVGLPWQSDDIVMPPSYDMALRRLKSIERKMNRSPEFKTAYTNQVRGLLEKGYAEEVTNENTNDKKHWYLPHFAVLNPNKPNKVRMVFDAAAKSNGVCLNDALLDGPDLLQSLLGILFGFRTKRIAVTADIREMFLRVKIRPEDRVAQHFLWREDNRTNPPRKYVMTSMIFGARSSPFLAHSVRDKNASEYKETHPLAYEAITQKHYMDDWIDSFDSKELARRAMSQVIQIHGKAGFELASWSSNCEELMADIPTENRAHAPKEIGSSAHPYNKALGIRWTPGTDELGFNTQMTRVPEDVKNLSRVPTKREALSAVMSLFDPLGLLSPYTITAKITLQELWRKKIDWDEPLPPEETVAFTEWQTELNDISQIRLQRCYDVRHDIKERQLHVFCDASEQAFATVAYWRFKDHFDHVNVAIVAGKAKVAPLKAQSIPRMELQAALIGVRLATTIKEKHPWNDVEVIFWTDSKTVLHWIKNDALKYTPYVAHRLSEIAEFSQPEQWRWIPTEHNVADDATRSGNVKLNSQSRWFTGPAFLYEDEQQWPAEPTLDRTPLEVIVLHTSKRLDLIDTSRFSSYERLVRALAQALLFIDKCKKRVSKLTVKHLREAERLIIRETQKESFPAELEQLKKGKSVDRKSRLHNLDPTYDKDELIRLNSRINAANVPEEHRNPPILDGTNHVTRLMIRQEHTANHHAGREQLVNNLRQRYWILRLRPTVRNIIKECVVCKTRRAAPTVPIKGNLPAARLNSHTRPFTNCGIDCYGPMFVTIGRRREKRWGMLFTCLVTRAIHIELIASLSTDSAIMALRRMAARRGMPKTIISDNATNFHGANTELRNAYVEWLPALENYAMFKRIEWRYIDPGAPNQGGAWERMIRSVKIAMLTTLTDRAPKEEVLQTLTTEIEHTVNSRPLTHVPVNPEDQEALTPNHFLLGTSTGLPFVGECEEADKRTWRAAQALANSFWTRWVKEYLPTLAPRGDNNRSTSNVKPGDLVIIADGLLPRNVWPRGVIERVHEGPDGVVRSAEVRTKGGVFRRPARRLVVLPVEEGSEDLRRGETVADSENHHAFYVISDK